MKFEFQWPWQRRGQRISHQSNTELSSDDREVLERIRRKLFDRDPETESQWKSLEYALERRESMVTSPERVHRMRPLRFAVIASGFAITATIAFLFWPRVHSPIIYETGKGQLSTITLSDSSEVTLNYASKLIVNNTSVGQPRHVILLGEAFFHVRKNGSPFILSTDIATVQVTGTEFGVRCRGGRLDVGVLTGAVNVSANRNGRDSTVHVVSGQFTQCGSAGFPGPPALLAQSGYPGWIHGKLLFDRADVAAVCAEIESRFNIMIEVRNPKLKAVTITGALDAQSVQTALSTLAQLTGASFKHENNAYILY